MNCSDGLELLVYRGEPYLDANKANALSDEFSVEKRGDQSSMSSSSMSSIPF